MTLTEAQIAVLYQHGLIENTTCYAASRALRGDLSISGRSALRMCEVAIEALVERAIDAACAVIQDKLGVQTGDLAAAVLSGGVIERELTRYVHAELEAQTTSTMAAAIEVANKHSPKTRLAGECSTCGAIHDDVDCFGKPVRP